MARTITIIPARKTTTSPAVTGTKLIRVASYCRVSTEHDDQLGSFQNQVEYYTNLIATTPGWVSAGIFADEGISGTGTKKRSGFMDMIKACDEGLVDLVITKSISRFARNTADSLKYSRHLKSLGIPIIFEKEGVNTMESSGELMYTILSSLAQEESRNISENCAWGIRSKFQQGIPHLNTECLLGYDKAEDGSLVINEAQAQVVKRIYTDYLEGWHPAEIARHLNAEGVAGVHGEAKWHQVSITRILQNEIHCGDLLMQKTYTADYLTKVQAENDGRLEQYFIQDNHPPIIPRSRWDAVQLEIAHRKEYRRRHQVNCLASCIDDPFYCRVFDQKTGARYLRRDWRRNRDAFWKVHSSNTIGKNSCRKIPESVLQKAVVSAWNNVVKERDTLLPRWRAMVEGGDALQQYYGQMMIDITADGPLERFVPELSRLMVEEIIVSSEELVVLFKDGMEKTINRLL